MVLSTPWGGESEWSHQSLLSTFHNETLGGEKFFLILERVMPDPATNLELLELMYLCLSIGFKGKYLLQASGEQQLEDLRAACSASFAPSAASWNRSCHPTGGRPSTVGTAGALRALMGGGGRRRRPAGDHLCRLYLHAGQRR